VAAPGSIPAAPVVTIVTNPSCSSATGTLRIQAPGSVDYGTGYEFSNDGGATWGPSPQFTFTAGGGYNLAVRRTGTTTCYATAVCSPASGSNIAPGPNPVKAPDDSDLATKTETQMSAYPIPFSDKTTIEFKSIKDEDYDINLYDLKGNLIKQLKSGRTKAGEITKVTVDGRGMAESIYLVRKVSKSGVSTVKLLKKE